MSLEEMSLEEPDTATAGTPRHDDDRGHARRRRNVALAVGVGALTIAAAVAAAVLVGGGGGGGGGANPVTPEAAATHDSPARAAVAPVSLPGTPVVSVGPAGTDGCPARWTVDDGGSPLVGYVVTHESPRAPPGPDGVEIGTALQAERTTATTSTAGPGWTIRVSAENALGSGPTSAPVLCG